MPTLRNLTTGDIIANNVRRADDVLSRMIGFLPYHEVSHDDGLWFPHCSAIHTVGMRSLIDVIFLDARNRVLRVVSAVPRHRFAVACAGAEAVIELGCGTATKRDILKGDLLSLEERDA